MPILRTEKTLTIAFGEGDLAISIAYDLTEKPIGIILYEDKNHSTEGKKLSFDSVPIPHVFISFSSHESAEIFMLVLKKMIQDTF